MKKGISYIILGIVILVGTWIFGTSCSDNVTFDLCVDKGDLRMIITDKYVMVEKCIGTYNTNTPIWKQVYMETNDTLKYRIMSERGIPY